MKLAITGGGSGGHTLPAITIYDACVEHFKNQGQDSMGAIYIGSYTGIEKKMASEKAIPFYPISTGKLRRYFSLANFTDIFRIAKGIFDAYKILKKFKPNLLFSTGGFVSVPPVIVSKLLGIPVVIHEQTSSIGLANKIAARFAQKIAITFSSSKQYFPAHKVIQTGQPIRKELFTGSRESCYKLFNFDTSLPLLYITGGSQGSHKINLMIKEILPELLEKCQIVQQCGKTSGQNDFEDLSIYKTMLPKQLKNRYVVKEFITNELKDILNGCDLLIGRSGAGTVNEAMALAIPSLFIPLAIATRNEQYSNAKMMADTGGAVIIEESTLSACKLKESIFSIIFNEAKKKAMCNNLKDLSNGNATDLIVKLILDIANK